MIDNTLSVAFNSVTEKCRKSMVEGQCIVIQNKSKCGIVKAGTNALSRIIRLYSNLDYPDLGYPDLGYPDLDYLDFSNIRSFSILPILQ